MTPAFRLVTACCRWPNDDARRTAIARLATPIEDWDEVVRLADRHRVEPLVAHGLAAVGRQVPAALHVAVEHQRALALRDVGESLRVAAALHHSGIEHRFLKGAPLGVAAYGSPLLKRSWDIDLLVHPADAVTCAALLAALGYEPVTPSRTLDEEEFLRWSVVSKEAILRGPNGSIVELHWRVSDHPMLLPTLDASSPSRLIKLLGEHDVATFGDEANLAYLAVHGTSHAWFRLKWLADFNALLAAVPLSERKAVLDGARALGVGHAIETAIGLSQHLFGDESPASPANRLVALSLRALQDHEEAADRHAGRARSRLDSRARYRAIELLIRLRGSEDRLHLRLPPRWQFLYPLLRLPLWFHRRFGPIRS